MVLRDSGLHDAIRACEQTPEDVSYQPHTPPSSPGLWPLSTTNRTINTDEPHAPSRNPSHTCQLVIPPHSATFSPPSRTGSPLSMQCMHRDSLRLPPLLYMHEYTAQHSDGSDMHMQRCVRACASLGRGMRLRQRCWEQSARLGASRRCGIYLGSMRMKRVGETRALCIIEGLQYDTRSQTPMTFPPRPAQSPKISFDNQLLSRAHACMFYAQSTARFEPQIATGTKKRSRSEPHFYNFIIHKSTALD